MHGPLEPLGGEQLAKLAEDIVLKGRGGPPMEAEWLDARPLMPGVPALGDGPDVQLWPHLHGTDAMFVSALGRRR